MVMLDEQRRTGQINKPLEMLLSIAHLLTGGRATPGGTHEKEQRNQVITQNVRNGTRVERSVDPDRDQNIQENVVQNDVGLEHVLELESYLPGTISLMILGETFWIPLKGMNRMKICA